MADHLHRRSARFVSHFAAHGPDAAPTEAMTVRANAESAIRRRATVTAPREPAVDWLELADRRAEAAAVCR